MSDVVNQDTCKKALEVWGEDFQMNMVVEELAELIHAIQKFRRGRASVKEVAEEHADVLIMLTQLGLIMSDHSPNYIDQVTIWERAKTERLRHRLIEFDIGRGDSNKR